MNIAVCESNIDGEPSPFAIKSSGEGSPFVIKWRGSQFVFKWRGQNGEPSPSFSYAPFDYFEVGRTTPCLGCTAYTPVLLNLKGYPTDRMARPRRSVSRLSVLCLGTHQAGYGVSFKTWKIKAVICFVGLCGTRLGWGKKVCKKTYILGLPS